MLIPLVRVQLRTGEQIGEFLLRVFGQRHVRAIRRIAAIILRPQAVQYKAQLLVQAALLRIVIAGAEIGRPRQRYHVEIEIAGRVRDNMTKFLEDNDRGLGLRANVGVLLCDYEYSDAQQVMRDIDIARGYLREGLYTNPTIFDRDMLKKK